LSKSVSNKSIQRKSGTTNPPAVTARENRLEVQCPEGGDPDVETARVVAGPYAWAGYSLLRLDNGQIGKDLRLQDFATSLKKAAKKLEANDLSDVEAMLLTQGLTLNVMFHDLTGRMARNLHGGGEYRTAMECYLKLAFRAQDQCRRTFETLGALKTPQTVFAKQANINNGGQQQVNNGAVSRPGETEHLPNELMEESHGERMDSGAPDKTGDGHSALATMAEVNRT
jgi:hypothetical protein